MREKMMKVTHRAAWLAMASGAAGDRARIEPIYSRVVGGDRSGGEYICRCVGPAYIEPQWGYVISKSGRLVEQSMLPHPPRDDFHTPPWRLGTPSPVDFWRMHALGRGEVKHFPAVISLRHFWEWNYFHFHADVLGKLRLLDEQGIDPSIPIILGRYAIELPFVQQILEVGALKDRNWIVQDRSFIRADEIIFCRSLQRTPEKIAHVVDLMAPNRPAVAPERRLFLTRKPGSMRRILNDDEVAGVVRAYGFEVVQAEDLPIVEQIELFSGARYLIGIHGAGLVNIMHRRGSPLSMLELHASNYRTSSYSNICREFGFDWDGLPGEPDDNPPQHASFTVPIRLLDEKIRLMVAKSSR